MSFLQMVPAAAAPAAVLDPSAPAPVVQLPGRAFPGVVLQGDTVALLCAHVAELRGLLGERTPAAQAGAGELVDELWTRLNEIRQHYEDVLKAHGIALPY